MFFGGRTTPISALLHLALLFLAAPTLGLERVVSSSSSPGDAAADVVPAGPVSTSRESSGDSEQKAYATSGGDRRRTAIRVPQLAGAWERIKDFPVDVGEGQGTLIGCDLFSVGGFYPNFASGPTIPYALDLCDPNADWRALADSPTAPFLTHGAHAHKGDNLFFMCGGYLGTHAGESIDNCYVFDKTDGPNGSWKNLPSLPKRRGGGGMVYIESKDTLLFAMGALRRKRNTHGIDKHDAWTLDLSDVDFDDPSKGAQWKARFGGGPYLGNHVTAVVANDCSENKRYFFLGGQVGELEKSDNIDLVYEYVVSTGEFVQKTPLPEPRGHFTVSNAPYGCGFITIGGAINGDPTRNTWSDDILYYDIDSDSWIEIGAYPELIKTPVCGIVSDVLYCANGYTVNSYKVALSLPAPTPPTAAPITPTAAPITPTMAPVTPTAAPVTPTTAPVTPTTAPVTPTAAPITPTTAPITPSTAPFAETGPQTVVNVDFDDPPGFSGFIFVKDLFVDGDDQYTKGSYGKSKGRPKEGSSTATFGVSVQLGGFDDEVGVDMSAGFMYEFTTTDPLKIMVKFDYRIFFPRVYDDGDETIAIVAMDDDSSVFDYRDNSSYGWNEWSEVAVDFGTIQAGTHVFKLGGTNNKKNHAKERTIFNFDNVRITGILSPGETWLLATGDLAIVQYNADSVDDFAFAALVAIPEGTKVMFTDKGWGEDGGFGVKEGVLEWTATASVDEGIVVTVIPSTGWASVGSVVDVGGTINFGTGGDQILIYQETSAGVNLIFALNNQGNGWQDDNNKKARSVDPDMLPSYAKLALDEVDNAAYHGTAMGTKESLLVAITDTSNWRGSDTDKQTTTITKFALSLEEMFSLEAGDIAIVQYNADGVDNFAFVTLVAIPAGTEIIFTDAGWLKEGAFRPGEGVLKWTATSAVGSGQVVTIVPSEDTASLGDVTNLDGTIQFSARGDQVFAFQGNRDAPTLLFAMNNNKYSWQDEATNDKKSSDPVSLPPYAKMTMKEIDNAAYTGTKTGTRESLLVAITDEANWTGNDLNHVNVEGEFVII